MHEREDLPGWGEGNLKGPPVSDHGNFLKAFARRCFASDAAVLQDRGLCPSSDSSAHGGRVLEEVAAGWVSQVSGDREE